ncbi:transglycosylase SLT domain-containing protein [Methylobrevis pamukkalensis]|uniref:Transglycosylase SLT domain-containing protein n=1 Tax=Methylobrevis pamukkalensis TaxID=1439726 RepID=A0A1E3H8A6_9HYPH|nr:transglycosylase SLT domain-containing protein [Methylobrevis pamukkalensis]ODN72026.1 hypothetical protein A6302_00651 [Methylobrevis pamukkalensis]
MKPIFSELYTSTPSTAGRKSAATVASRIDQAFETAGDTDVGSRIAQAFDAASDSTGTSFEYLVKTAQRESAMNPEAKARTSSATGLFQFIESTWLETLKKSGEELGLGRFADQVTVTESGKYTVADPKLRQEILALRKDPEISSMMAGALTRQNAQFLNGRIGREPSDGELYIAHFLGAGGAAKLIRLAESAPEMDAAQVFSKQAAANRSIFYEKDGSGRSVAEVYDRLVTSHDSPTRTMLAAMPKAGETTAATAYADSNTGTDGTAASRVASGWRAADPDAAFDALFRNDGGAAVPLASAFWKGFAATPGLFALAVAEDDAAATAAAVPGPLSTSPSLVSHSAVAAGIPADAPLDLGQFLKPEARRRI